MSFFKPYRAFLVKNKLYAVLVGLTLVLAYGFYATHYTVHIDQLVPEYYNGLLLVSAGRWAAPLIHLFTDWMDFAPFWHTAVMALLLFFAAVEWCVLFRAASAQKLSSAALIAFSCVFVSYPVLEAQLTYPVLNITLAFLLVPAALRLLLAGFMQKKGRAAAYAAAAALLVFAVDMYESFAAVFLVGLFAVLLLLYLYHDGFPKKYGAYVKLALVAVGLLACAVLLDMAVSRLLNLILCGKTEFWYSGNTMVQWTQRDFFSNVKRFASSLIATYLYGSLSLPFLTFFLVSGAAGAAVCIAFSVKKRSALPVLLYVGMAGSVFALSAVVGQAIPFTQMQMLPVFTAFPVLLLAQHCASRQWLRAAAACVLAVIVLNQTKEINNYAVRNYERYQCEAALLCEIGDALQAYDIKNKPVFFYDKDYSLPRSMYAPQSGDHPLQKAYAAAAGGVLDRLMPVGFYARVSRYYNRELPTAADVSLTVSNQFTCYWSFIGWANFDNNYQKLLARLGYTVTQCTGEQYEALRKTELVNDPSCPFRITEMPDVIIVQIMGTGR